jgi:MraZ protein
MFWGSYDHTLDEKGRTALPKEFRTRLAELKGKPWITLSRGCLLVLPDAEFRDLQSRYAGHSERREKLRRLTLGMAQPCTIDKQGRFLIPQILREKGHLQRDLVITGVGEHIEIWDRALHARELEDVQTHYGVYTSDLDGTEPPG